MTPATVSARVVDVMRSFGRQRQMTGTRRFWRKRLPPIEQLLIVPQDLRSADPGFAFEVAEGAFGLSGISARLVDGSPFAIPAPHHAWEQELHGFGWLRNYSTGRTPAMAEHARDFVLEWIVINGGKNRTASRPEVRARRVLSWLAHADVVLDGADRRDYDVFMASLAKQILDLQRRARKLPAGWPRLISSIALLQAFLALPNADAERRLAELRLTAEIDNQILTDGGHISRDPGVLIDILLDLVPLRQCFVARRLACPEAITSAIRRIIPMLRHLRLGDGSIARFNGMGVTMPDALATALAFDSNTQALPALAPDSRYARLEAANTIVVMDTGATPPTAHAKSAHAGCLSFELSAGRTPIFVNAGNPNPAEHTSRFAPPRATSSHSGLVIAETSSATLIDTARTRDRAARLHGPVSATFSADAETLTIDATHAGYSARFGLMHRRQLALSRDGITVSGVDQLIPTPKRQPACVPCAIHFHLHPSVTMRMGWSPNSVLLTLSDGEQWRFSADNNATLSIEVSAHHALGAGSRHSQQLVLRRMIAAGTTEVRWTLSRLTGAVPPASIDTAEGPPLLRSLADALAAVTVPGR